MVTGEAHESKRGRTTNKQQHTTAIEDEEERVERSWKPNPATPGGCGVVGVVIVVVVVVGVVVSPPCDKQQFRGDDWTMQILP